MARDTSFIIIAILVVITIGLFGLLIVSQQPPADTTQLPPPPQPLPQQPQPSPQPPPQNGTSGDRHIVAGGELTFERPNDFGLAINQEQVLVESTIPPCAEGFDYCLYYNAPTYEGTNFESAGLRIERRNDLAAQEECLQTQPAGYSNLEPSVRNLQTYSTSMFSPIGDSGSGHTSEGVLYRLAFDSTCFEFETRIGTSNFETHEPGTVEEFTEQDKETLEQRLHQVLENVRFTDNPGEVLFP